MHTTRTLLPHSSLVLAACLALGACKAKDKEAAATDTATTPAAATATPPAPAPAESGTSAASAALTDANIVALLDEANSADSALAAAALPKATGADVKGFAKMMMGEHHALRIAGQQLAKKLNVNPQLPTDDPLPAAAKGETDALQGKTGADFDMTYIAVVSVEDGRFTSYRDYWNPLAVQEPGLDFAGSRA